MSNYSIDGMNWVADQAQDSGLPSVASMSLGGPGSKSMDKAVKGVCTEWERDGDTTDERSHL